MSIGMEVIWEWIPERLDFPFYTIAVCTIDASIAGIYRKNYGDYPEELEVMLGKVKTEK